MSYLNGQTRLVGQSNISNPRLVNLTDGQSNPRIPLKIEELFATLLDCATKNHWPASISYSSDLRPHHIWGTRCKASEGGLHIYTHGDDEVGVLLDLFYTTMAVNNMVANTPKELVVILSLWMFAMHERLAGYIRPTFSKHVLLVNESGAGSHLCSLIYWMFRQAGCPIEIGGAVQDYPEMNVYTGDTPFEWDHRLKIFDATMANYKNQLIPFREMAEKQAPLICDRAGPAILLISPSQVCRDPAFKNKGVIEIVV